MRNAGIAALAIHGDKKQQERDWVLAEFKAGRSPIMIATDVAARGIDVNDVKVRVSTFRHCALSLVDCMSPHIVVSSLLSILSLGPVITCVQLVVNFDMPNELEDYVHRIGRTGRKTKEGYASGTAIR